MVATRRAGNLRTPCCDPAAAVGPPVAPPPEQEVRAIAESTESSTVVAAPAPAVLDVISDLPAYPQWAKGVKSVDNQLLITG